MAKESGSSEQPRLATGFESVANGFEHRQGGCLHTQRQCLLSTGEKVSAGKVEEGWRCGRVWTPVAWRAHGAHSVSRFPLFLYYFNKHHMSVLYRYWRPFT